MNIDFCETCREFISVRLSNKKYYCKECIKNANQTFTVVKQPLTVAKQPLIKPSKILKKEPKKELAKAKVKNIEESKVSKSFIKKERTQDELIDYQELLGAEVYTTFELIEKLNHRCMNIRSFNNKLDRLVKSGKLYKRYVYHKGHRAYNIYSTSEEAVKQAHGKETQKLIYEAIKEKAPLTTKELCNKIGFSDRNITKLIRNKLADVVQIWRRENKYYYITSSENDLQKLLKIEPKVVRIQ